MFQAVRLIPRIPRRSRIIIQARNISTTAKTTTKNPNRIYSIKSALALPSSTSTNSIISNDNDNDNESIIIINGWIRSCRRQKNLSFAVINDGSNLKGLQVVLSKELDLDKKLTVGCSASIRGSIVESKGKGQEKEFRAEFVEILGVSDAETYPIQNTKQGVPLTVLRKNAHLRPRTSAIAVMLRLRSRMAWATHQYFMGEEYLQVQTPLITSSDCEGAGEVFEVVDASAPSPMSIPPTPTSSSSSSTTIPTTTSTIPTPRYLTVSSQLHLEAIAASFSKVYTLSPSFRAEKSDTARHLQEFWMLEAEVGFLPSDERVGLEQVMNVAEGVVISVVRDLWENNKEDLDYFFDQTPGLEDQIKSLLDSPPFPRITYSEAVLLLEAHVAIHPNAFVYKPSWGASLQTEHEKWLAEEHFKGPVFVTDYPSSQKPWYMLPNPSSSTLPSTPESTSACFDLLVPRLGELAGGSLREHRLEELIIAMKSKGIEVEDYEWYKDLREYGSTRHGGFGMGWERLIGFVTGLENVRECTAFPRAAEGSRF